MAGIDTSGVVSGLQAGFNMMQSVQDRKDRKEREDREYGMRMQDRADQRARQAVADERSAADYAVRAADEEKKSTVSQFANIATKYGSFETAPKEVQDAAVEAARKADDLIAKSRSKRNELAFGKQRQDLQNIISNLQTGRVNLDDVSDGDFYRAMGVSLNRDPGDYAPGPNGEPSVMAKGVGDLTTGMQTNNKGMMLQGANTLLASDLRKGVGTESAHGGKIVAKEIVDFVPHPNDPNHVTPVIRVYVDEGKDFRGPRGKHKETSYYDVPLTENRSSDPNGTGAPTSKVKPVTPGNIDLANRPTVKNKDGSVSTVRSMGVNFDGKEVLIPTVSEDGRILTDEQAIQQYRKTGKHLGMFNTPEEATQYAKDLHDAQAKKYVRGKYNETSYYDAPLTENRSSDPNDPVKFFDMQSAMDRVGQIGTLTEILRNKDILAKLNRGRETAGAQTKELIDRYSMEGQNAAPKKTITTKDTRIPADGGYTLRDKYDAQGRLVGQEKIQHPERKERTGSLETRLALIDRMRAEGDFTPAEAQEAEQAAFGIRPRVGRGGGGGGAGGRGGKVTEAAVKGAIADAVKAVAADEGLTFNAANKSWVNRDGSPASADAKARLDRKAEAVEKTMRDGAAKGRLVPMSEALDEARKPEVVPPKPAPSKFVVGQTYVNPKGQKAVYQADNTWKEVK